MNVHGPKRPHAVLCPVCGDGRSRVMNTRPSAQGIYRRRLCVNGHRFSTEEVHRVYAQPKKRHNM